jgi:hypothetical protein
MGNIKNPDLIAEKLQKAEESHTADYIRNAALDALSGQVLCIGYRVDHQEQNILCSDADGEAHLLRQWWALINYYERQPKLVGFNIRNFDLPFLIKRSWRHRIMPPYWLHQGRYWSELVIDLREVCPVILRSGQPASHILKEGTNSSRFDSFSSLPATLLPFLNHPWNRQTIRDSILPWRSEVVLDRLMSFADSPLSQRIAAESSSSPS